MLSYSGAYHSLPWWRRPNVVVELPHIVIVRLQSENMCEEC